MPHVILDDGQHMRTPPFQYCNCVIYCHVLYSSKATNGETAPFHLQPLTVVYTIPPFAVSTFVTYVLVMVHALPRSINCITHTQTNVETLYTPVWLCAGISYVV